MSRVLAAVDSSPCAPAVLQTAVALAALLDARASALHVGEGAGEDLGEAVRSAASECGVEVREAAGEPIEAIVAAAEEPDVVAVVLGARGTPKGPRPAGHAALAVIGRVAKPVVVVPPDVARRGRDGRMRGVLIPLEGTDHGARAVAAVAGRIASGGAEIHILHVHRREAVPAFEDQPVHARHAWEREFASRFVLQPVAPVSVIRRVGDAAEHLLDAAAQADADLILLSWGQQLDGERALVVREALANSRVPVMLVPAG